MQNGNANFIYKNELDKACFQHDMAYGKSEDLVKRTQSDKVSKNKAFKIASDPKYDKFFDKKSKRSSIVASLANKSANKPNYQLADELHKPIIRKFKKREVYSSYRDNIWLVCNH